MMPYLTAGFPDEKTFAALVVGFMKAGADLIEIGVPFSDPVADGRSIQYSSQRALQNGINVDKIFRMLAELSKTGAVPFILMSYYNPILSYGMSRFTREAKAVGVSGLIIPDMIPEEGQDAEAICASEGIDLIYLLAPTSGIDRRKNIIKRSRGFVYLVSVTGVTGGRKHLPGSLNSWVRRVKKESPLPVCVGFGISTPGQAKSIANVADGVIVGRAIIDLIKGETDSGRAVRKACGFIRSLKKAMNTGGR